MIELQKNHQKIKLDIQSKDGINKKPAKQVLLADDESAFRELFSDILQTMGFEVTGCKDGLEAFTIFSKSPEKFHLILTDYMMPYIDGVQLAKKIRAINRNVPIALCTGIPSDVDIQLLKCDIINVLLPKPLALAEFKISIKRLMP